MKFLTIAAALIIFGCSSSTEGKNGHSRE